MNNLVVMVSALTISMALIPLLVRFAPALGMMDRPDPRKVHAVPVPRVGGIGIVIGALVPVLLWGPSSVLLKTYLYGAFILLIFGVWDDIKELGHYAKFIGQILSVVPVVYIGDLYVQYFPFMGLQQLNPGIGKAFTVFAIIGVINATNHSDGLDGLAGGLTLLSVVCICYLASLGDDSSLLFLISAAAAGGIFGFLRFNTHPAQVFMGDGGSQFLGFTLGFLTVMLTQKVNTAISMALPALILGLPVIDIVAVFAQRIYHGMNWFRATKNHIHHRLLQLRFAHYEVVVIIYLVHSLLVVSSVAMRYSSDLAIVGLYLGICGLLFTGLTLVERIGWHARRVHGAPVMSRILQSFKPGGVLQRGPVYVLSGLLSALLVVGSAGALRVPLDLGIAAAALMVLLAIGRFWEAAPRVALVRLPLYVGVAAVLYLLHRSPVPIWSECDPCRYGLFFLAAAAFAVSVRFGGETAFELTPMDFLMLLFIGVAGIAFKDLLQQGGYAELFVGAVLAFYAVELLLLRGGRPARLVLWSGATSLLILSGRALL